MGNIGGDKTRTSDARGRHRVLHGPCLSARVTRKINEAPLELTLQLIVSECFSWRISILLFCESSSAAERTGRRWSQSIEDLPMDLSLENGIDQ